METMEEVLAKENIVRDIKARRVLNTAPDKDSGITLAEIMTGVSIETLESLDVPVYLYGGQLTIHGTFKDDVKDLRVAGYKSIFKNGNGSLGVKYVAVDGAKKQRLDSICDLSCDKNKWRTILNSSGLQAYRSFNNKEEALACYQNAPSCFVGTKTAFRSVYGNFYVVLEIGAIYDKEFWNLVKDLTGLDEISVKVAEEAKAAKRKENEARWEQESILRNQEIKKMEEERKVWREEAEKKLSSTFKSTTFSGAGVYIYAFTSKYYQEKRGYMVIDVKKGGFGRMMIKKAMFREISQIKAEFPSTEKAKVMDNTTVDALKVRKLFKF